MKARDTVGCCTFQSDSMACGGRARRRRYRTVCTVANECAVSALALTSSIASALRCCGYFRHERVFINMWSATCSAFFHLRKMNMLNMLRQKGLQPAVLQGRKTRNGARRHTHRRRTWRDSSKKSAYGSSSSLQPCMLAWSAPPSGVMLRDSATRLPPYWIAQSHLLVCWRPIILGRIEKQLSPATIR